MKIEFFGVRGSIPRPLQGEELLQRLIDHSDGESISISTLKNMMGNGGLGYGANTSCVYVEKDDQHIIIDAGTGIRALGERLIKTPVDKPIHLLLTHLHWDHIQGLPFFAPIYQKGRTVKVYSAIPKESLEKAFVDQWRAPYFPVPYEALLSNIHYVHFENSIDIGPCKVEAIPMMHPDPTYGYKISSDGKSYAHFSDTELRMLNSEMTEDYKNFLSGVDLLVTDSQFDEDGIEQFKGWGHSSITGFIDLLKDAKVKTMALFHHNPQTPESYIDGLYQGAQEHLKTVIPDGSTNLICAIEGQSLTL